MITVSSEKYCLPQFVGNGFNLMDIWRIENVQVTECKYTILGKDPSGIKKSKLSMCLKIENGNVKIEFEPRTRRVYSKTQLRDIELLLNGSEGALTAPEHLVPFLDEKSDQVSLAFIKRANIQKQFHDMKTWSARVK